MKSEEWRAQALCRGRNTDIWFPVDQSHSSTRRIAQATCKRCEVSTECLAYALERGERFGIWGGLSENQRARLRHQPGRPA